MLTPSAVANTKPQAKSYKLTDERGMYLLVKPDGARWWRFDYRRPESGKRNTLSLGTFPDVSLRKASDKRDEARTLLADGIDPGSQRKAAKAAGVERAANSFAALADEWLAKQAPRMAAVTLSKARWTFADLVCPWVGSRPIADIDAPEMVTLLRRIEERGAHETAHRTKQRCGQVFRYAIATGRAT